MSIASHYTLSEQPIKLLYKLHTFGTKLCRQDSKVHTKFHLSPLTAPTHLTSLIDRINIVLLQTFHGQQQARARPPLSFRVKAMRDSEKCVSPEGIMGNEPFQRPTIFNGTQRQASLPTVTTLAGHKTLKYTSTQRLHRGYMNIEGASIECHWVF